MPRAPFDPGGSTAMDASGGSPSPVTVRLQRPSWRVAVVDWKRSSGLEAFVQRAHDSLDEQLAPVTQMVAALRPKPQPQPVSTPQTAKN